MYKWKIRNEEQGLKEEYCAPGIRKELEKLDKSVEESLYKLGMAYMSWEHLCIWNMGSSSFIMQANCSWNKEVKGLKEVLIKEFICSRAYHPLERIWPFRSTETH